jgi:hypothetical protein
MTKKPRSRNTLIVYIIIAVAAWAIVEAFNTTESDAIVVEPTVTAEGADTGVVSGGETGASGTTANATRTRVPTKTPRRRRTATPQSNPVSDWSALRARSGFDVNRDGFSFENYGNEPGIRNLKTADMQRMFGNDVCSRVKNDVCTLSPAARQWMREINNAMDGGHCEGMAVLSVHLFHDLVAMRSFGATQTADLDLYSDDALQGEIAYWWATQMTTPTTNSFVTDTPVEIVERLSQWMQDAPSPEHIYTVGFYKRDYTGGHAVTPIGIEPLDDRYVAIVIYDNNYPNQERQIVVDMVRNTWSYDGSPNPDIESDLYEGDAASQTLELTPSAPRIVRQDCDFCAGAKGSTSGKGSTVFFLSAANDETADAEVSSLFVTPDGRRIGYLDGELINEIDGATISVVKSGPSVWDNRGAPMIRIPAGESVSLQMTSSITDNYAITAFYDGRVIHIDDLAVSEEASEIGFGDSLDDLWLESYEDGDIDIYFGDEDEDADSAYFMQLTDFDLASEERVSFRYNDADGTFVIDGNDDGAYDLDIVTSDAEGDVAFSIDDVATLDGSSVKFNIDSIDAEGDTLEYNVDETGDGSYESDIDLSDDDLSISEDDFAADELEEYIEESLSNP